MGSNDDPAIKSGELPDLPNPDLNELRQILLGDNWRKLAALEREILDHGNFSRRVAEVLPDSLRSANDTPANLVGAMQDPTIESISVAARKEQERLSEALAPVIGPSIQRAIGQALQKFTQSIETIAQHNFSVKGLKWRVESARTGIPFHQVILKHTLKYEVEQVYLIQKPSGLLVTHLMHPDLAEQNVDRDAIAGMMMAIQDFVRDAAFAESSEPVQTIDMKGKTVWMCHGAWALLACVIEGRPPESLRGDIKSVLDTIHGRYQHPLREFNGDLHDLGGVEQPLQPLLQRELIDDKVEGAGKSRKPMWLYLAGAAFIGWLIYVAYIGYETHKQRGRLEFALKETPGVVVTDLDHVKGVWVAKGMADPLAFDATKIAQSAMLLPKQLRLEFLPYVSLDPQLVLRRARAALDAPASVELRLNEDALVATGLASEAWVTRLKNTNSTMLNVDRIDASKLNIDFSAQLKQISEQLSATKIYFADHLQLANNAEGQLLAVVELISRANEMAASSGKRVQIILIGQADASGSPAINDALRLQRTQLVKARLIALGAPEQVIRIQENHDVAAENDSSNRRVDFQFELVAKTPT
jgi:outer membrane protein OmpA-like peptidoglycan-associated protein